MLVLAGVIVIEKVLVPGRWFSVVVGLAAFGLGLAIWINPAVAAGFYAKPMMGAM
jgi:hypothetical protein